MFKGKKVYDLTRTLSSKITVWPGDEGVTVSRVLSISEGGAANVSKIDMGVHSGTHMDAPLHFIEGGADITSLSPDKLMGEAYVVETNKDEIDELFLEGIPFGRIGAVFFKTPCSHRDEKAPFLGKYPALTEGCAEKLIEKGIQCVGCDYLSIECCTDNTFSVHKRLLAHGIVIVENLCMANIEPGLYSYICLPLKIEGADGSPCRTLLFK